MSRFHLAQLNVAKLKAPLDSPQLADFVANLPRINELAEGSPGYVWRLQAPAGDATALCLAGEDKIVNLSVWTSVEALSSFVFRSGHVEIMKRRKEWLDRMAEAYVVLWWLPSSQLPAIEQALERLAYLTTHGPSEHAFTFRTACPAPDAPTSSPSQLPDECPAT